MTTPTMPITRFSGQYRFLSNFFNCPIVMDGITFPSVEHAYQAAKTQDPELRLAMSQTSDAGAVKRAGQQVVCRPDWVKVKLITMACLTWQKFNIPQLRDSLLLTGDAWLIEGNQWHDNYWGSCYCPKCLRIEGKNSLGQILMVHRDKLGGMYERQEAFRPRR